MNLKMKEFKPCLQSAGYGQVKTVLSRGNVAFDSPEAEESTLAKQLEHGKLFRSAQRRKFAQLRRRAESDIEHGIKRI